MYLVIELDEHDPPCGRVRREDGSPVPFVGWLGLLRVLADAFDDALDEPATRDRRAARSPIATRDLRGELDA